MNNDLALKTMEELGPLIRKREISPVELTKAVFNRIETINDKVNSYIHISKDNAIYNAKIAEQEILNDNYRGGLHGMPIALKDNIYVQHEATTVGSIIHKDFTPEYDATVVKKLKEAGAIFTGKLNMHEYAYGATTNNPHFGTCRNPWDLRKTPGGSSGGSAAAVASDLVIASLGTDTGGSIRIPSSFCGIVGLKPTYGRVSNHGCFPLAWSLDHIGPMTKSVYDAALLLETIAGYDEKDPSSVRESVNNYTNFLSSNIENMVIGIEEDYFFKDVDEHVEKAVRTALNKLEELGAKIVRIKIPSLKHLGFADWVTIATESSTVHRHNLLERPEDFGEDVRGLLKLGEKFSGIEYVQAQQARHQVSSELSNVFKEVDVIISPTVPFLPTIISEDREGINRFMGLANLIGIPALNIPCGFHDDMPIGMQIMGPAFLEENILNIGYALEKTDPLKGKKPNFDLSESIEL